MALNQSGKELIRFEMEMQNVIKMNKALEQFKGSVRNVIVRRAMRKALMPVKKLYKASIPKRHPDTGKSEQRKKNKARKSAPWFKTEGAKFTIKKKKVTTQIVKGDTWAILRKSIGTKIHTYRNSGVTIGVVGPRKNYFAANGERVDKILIGMEIGWKKRTKVTFRKDMQPRAGEIFLDSMQTNLESMIAKEAAKINQTLGNVK